MIQLETKKLALMLCGLVLLGLGLFVFGAFGERTSHAVTSPFVKIWRKASDSKDAAAEWVDAETAAKDKKIRELEEKVLELQLQVGDARDLRTENSQLRKLADLERHPGWFVQHAEVIVRDPVLWDYTFTIDKGMADGVTVGAVVMQAGNVAGRVAKVERHQATVETVLSPNCRFSVTIGSTGDAGVLHGVKGTDRTSPFRCQVDFLPLDIEAMAGMQKHFVIPSFQQQQESARKQFKSDCVKHIKDIATKYLNTEETSEFAYMFVPAEAVFAEIYGRYPDVIDYSYRCKVFIVSPTTLMAYITAIKAIYLGQSKNEKVVQMQQELQKLSNEFERFTARWANITKDFEKTSEDIQSIDTTAKKIVNQFRKIDNVELDGLTEVVEYEEH